MKKLFILLVISCFKKPENSNENQVSNPKPVDIKLNVKPKLTDTVDNIKSSTLIDKKVLEIQDLIKSNKIEDILSILSNINPSDRKYIVQKIKYEVNYMTYNLLGYSIIENYIPLVNLILDSDIDVNSNVVLGNKYFESFETSALSLAVRKRNIELVNNLLTRKNTNVNICDAENITPLISCCGDRANLNIIKALVDKGADINVVTHDNFTALSLLSIDSNENEEAIFYLIEKGADLDTCNLKFSEDESKKTGFMYILSRSNFELIKKALHYVKDINVKDELGRTALYHAINSDYLRGEKAMQVFKLFEEKGANFNFIDNQSNTLMHYLTELKDISVIDRLKFLISKDVNPNHKNNKGLTPLMEAVILATTGELDPLKKLSKEIIDTIEFLSDKSDKSLKSNEGKTALDYADGNGQIINILTK